MFSKQNVALTLNYYPGLELLREAERGGALTQAASSSELAVSRPPPVLTSACNSDPSTHTTTAF